MELLSVAVKVLRWIAWKGCYLAEVKVVVKVVKLGVLKVASKVGMTVELMV